MGELPTGTVTFMFTDIEGPTRLLHRLGPDYEQALRGHRRILRDTSSSCGGVEVDTQGDAFVAFATAADAVEAVARAQRALAQHRWPQQEELRVRMGIHTGEPTVTDEGYVGDDVHKERASVAPPTEDRSSSPSQQRGCFRSASRGFASATWASTASRTSPDECAFTSSSSRT